MKKPCTIVQDWDTIKDHPPSRPPSSTPEDEDKSEGNRKNILKESGECGSCKCDSCVDNCGRCVTCCLHSSVDCGHDCIGCCKSMGRQGWRKWCLFGIICLLIVIVIVNIALTLWIMRIMEFNQNGMGPLRINPGGIELTGKAYILDDLITSSIKTRYNQSLTLESFNNFTIKAADLDGRLENLIFIDNDTFTCRSNNLIIEDHTGKVLFSSSEKQLVIGSDELKVLGEGGIFFNQSIVTSNIESEPRKSLSIESLTRSLNISSAGEMLIGSKAGGIEVSSLKDINFKSRKGVIKLDSRKITMPNLMVAHLSRRPRKRSKVPSRIYQVCVCENGRLFLARPQGVCEMYDTAFLCK